MLRRTLTGKTEEAFPDPSPLMVGMNIQVIDKIFPHCHEGDGLLIIFHHKDLIFLQHMIAEIILILIKEMTIGALEFRQGFLACNPP